MASIQDIALKRWFMGKGSRIKSVTEEDRVEIAGNAITIVRITFATNRPPDLYATVEDESRIGGILDKAFSKARFTVPAKHGKFIFERTSGFPARISAEALDSIAPLDAEQSNSAYVSKRFFFKLYRRLLPGIHPEAEIMEHFGDIGYGGSPRLCGKCRYADASGILYTLGILENRCHGGTDAWAAFNKRMDERSAEALGKATAKMHRALKGLPGTPAQNPEVPFDKLEKLLRTFKSDNEQTQTLAVKLKAALPELKKLAKFPKGAGALLPQRIHGDFHLGQVLVSADSTADNKSPAFKILDFEGEPSRTLEYRRALRSPAVDIAGMLRSFQYAGAVSGQNSAACEHAFIEGYARTAHMDAAALENDCTPYILAKAVYEACYELEFRPDWFHIPARALLNFLYLGAL